MPWQLCESHGGGSLALQESCHIRESAAAILGRERGSPRETVRVRVTVGAKVGAVALAHDTEALLRDLEHAHGTLAAEERRGECRLLISMSLSGGRTTEPNWVEASLLRADPSHPLIRTPAHARSHTHNKTFAARSRALTL